MSSIPTTMKGWLVPVNGGREVLEFKTDLPVPKAEGSSILVKISHCGLNFIDSYFRSGLYPIATPYVAGREGAGEVVAVGSEVSKFSVGDRVVFLDAGVFAEYSTVDESSVVSKIPDEISYEKAAASFLQGLTALSMVREAYEVKKGDYILIQAAAGGMGLLLCQLVKSLGGHAIGTVSTEEKAELAKQNGAEYVINYSNEDYVKKVLEITNGLGCEAVLDGVGKATFQDSITCTRRKGTFVSFGNASGMVPPFRLQLLQTKNLRLLRPVLFNYLVTPEEKSHYFAMLWESLLNNSLNIKIYKTYPLEDYVSAAEALETRQSTGKVVLQV
ncbi:hypothetical protein V1511DRAFT_494720 [Dipodascopsis uninucleata]